ncbi:MAG: DUF896 domain-containing protein [Epulopiscium sp.]|nr:DUF896 domain-containing protein [Candidatus Epulonipiscium sp.]
MDELRIRINELCNKEKVEPLTKEEKEEQKQLREEYIKKFRAGFRQQLDNTKIKNPDGTVTQLKRKKKNG